MTAAVNTPPIRVLLAAGDQDRERALLAALAAADVEVVGRCLDGGSLARRGAEGGVDAALVGSGLHGLAADTLAALAAASVPAVVVLTRPADARRFAGHPYLMAGDDPVDIVAALAQAVRSGVDAPEANTPRDGAGVLESGGEIVAVTSAKGAPGATTLAIALAALGAGDASTALLDADLRGGDVVAYLGLDARRGLTTALARAADGGAGLPIQASHGFSVLTGVERPELAKKVAPGALPALARTLARRFERVVVDAGPATEEAGELLRAADRVLVVTTPGLVALWRTQVGLDVLRDTVGVEPGRLAVAVNRRDGHEHYDAAEIADALGVPVAAVVREDGAAARRAADEHRPLTAVRGHAALDLAALGAWLDGPEAPAKARRTTAGRGWRIPWPRIGRTRTRALGRGTAT